MRVTTTLVAGSLAVAASASIVDTVKDGAAQAIHKFFPLTPAPQIPCCGGTNCPYCPAIDVGADEIVLSVSYPSAGPQRAEPGNAPGCGEGFSADDCLRFFQVTLTGLDQPLEIAAGKAAPAPKGDVAGCGQESSPGACLRFLRSFFEEVMAPLETTLGAGSLTVPAPEAGSEKEAGKSEL